MSDNMFETVNEFMGAKWPDFLPRPSDPTVLDHVWIEPPQTTAEPDRVNLVTRLLFEREIVLGLPGLDAAALARPPTSASRST
jgi:hypothetical protein